MEISRDSDTMWLVRFGQQIDQQISQRAIDLATRLRSHSLRGIRDIVPAYCTVGVHFDPLQVDLVALERAIALESAVAMDTRVAVDTVPPIEIPVRYGGEDGPDLDALATWAGCSADEVIERHCAREYRVYMLGFVPGFAYLGKVDPRIAAPRHRTPRERVPAGSVGIAGEQTGVYPIATPGGWQIIGRTDVRLFDVSRAPANLLSAGHRVRFVPVSRAHR